MDCKWIMEQQIVELPVGKAVTVRNYSQVTSQDPKLFTYFVGEKRRRLGGIFGEQLVIYFVSGNGFIHSSYERTEKQLGEIRRMYPNAGVFGADLMEIDPSKYPRRIKRHL